MCPSACICAGVGCGRAAITNVTINGTALAFWDVAYPALGASLLSLKGLETIVAPTGVLGGLGCVAQDAGSCGALQQLLALTPHHRCTSYTMAYCVA